MGLQVSGLGFGVWGLGSLSVGWSLPIVSIVLPVLFAKPSLYGSYKGREPQKRRGLGFRFFCGWMRSLRGIVLEGFDELKPRPSSFYIPVYARIYLGTLNVT